MDPIVQRVLARFSTQVTAVAFDDDPPEDPHMVLAMGGFTMEREHYLPPEARAEKPLVPEGTDLEIYTWDGKGYQGRPAFYGIAFAGKANKPLWHYAFRTQSNRIAEIRKTIEVRKQYIETKKKQQEEKNNFVHGLVVGDILVCSWGYDQTNIDFYQVTAVKGKNVIIREIDKKIVDSAQTSDRVTAVPNRFVGEPMLKRPGGTTGSPSVKVHSFASAHKWDGKPEYQTNSLYGH